jgi:predicted ester cyclase
MPAEENMAMARRFMEAQVRGDLDALDDMLAPDFVSHNKLLRGQEPGRENFKRAVSAYRAAVSNPSIHFEDQVAGGDKVVTRFVVHGPHDRGDLMGVAPTGKVLTNRAIVIHRIVDGKIAEEWGLGTTGGTLRKQRLEQEIRERERIEQEMRVARGTSSRHHSLGRCLSRRDGRSPPTTSQHERSGETSTTSST